MKLRLTGLSELQQLKSQVSVKSNLIDILGLGDIADKSLKHPETIPDR